jgi:hypothetical protein
VLESHDAPGIYVAAYSPRPACSGSIRRRAAPAGSPASCPRASRA